MLVEVSARARRGRRPRHGENAAAVIDTGIDARHRDLDEGKVLAFADYSSGPCRLQRPSTTNATAPPSPGRSPVRGMPAPTAASAGSSRVPGSSGGLVLVSPFERHELGVDVLSRLARQELVRPSPLRAVMSLFAASDVDRRVARQRWLLDELLRVAPSEGYAPAEAATLTYERAWEELLRRGLGVPGAYPTLHEMVQWGADPGNAERLAGAGDELRAGLQDLLADVPGAAVVLAAIAHGPPGATVVGGIVARLLVEANGDPTAKLGAGRLAERFLGGAEMDLEQDAPAWADAAERLVREHGSADDVRRWSDDAAAQVEAWASRRSSAEAPSSMPAGKRGSSTSGQPSTPRSSNRARRRAKRWRPPCAQLPTTCRRGRIPASRVPSPWSSGSSDASTQDGRRLPRGSATRWNGKSRTAAGPRGLETSPRGLRSDREVTRSRACSTESTRREWAKAQHSRRWLRAGTVSYGDAARC